MLGIVRVRIMGFYKNLHFIYIGRNIYINRAYLRVEGGSGCAEGNRFVLELFEPAHIEGYVIL